MLLFSEQIKIIKKIVLTFKNNKITHTRITEKELNKYKFLLNENKYKSIPIGDFKLLVLITVMEITGNLNISKTLKILNSYTKRDIQKILKNKTEILLYKDTLDKDIENKINKINFKNVIKSYKEKKLSLFYVYYYCYCYLYSNQKNLRKNEDINDIIQSTEQKGCN